MAERVIKGHGIGFKSSVNLHDEGRVLWGFKQRFASFFGSFRVSEEAPTKMHTHFVCKFA